MSSKIEVTRLFKIWQSTRSLRCECPHHHVDFEKICERERAWRNYCVARDEYIDFKKILSPNKPKLNDLLDAFEDMPN